MTPARRGGTRRVRSATPPLRVRRARLADAAALAAVMRAAIRGVPRGTYPGRTLAAWASLPALYHAWAMTAGGETILVAELGGRIAGYGGLRGSEVTALFVPPAAARQGVASALLARIEALARRRGVTRLRVDAAMSGTSFYRARGFTGRRSVKVPLPGGSLAAVRMTKALTEASSRRPGSPR